MGKPISTKTHQNTTKHKLCAYSLGCTINAGTLSVIFETLNSMAWKFNKKMIMNSMDIMQIKGSSVNNGWPVNLNYLLAELSRLKVNVMYLHFISFLKKYNSPSGLIKTVNLMVTNVFPVKLLSCQCHSPTDDKSTMAWCQQATMHFLSQCWPRSMSPYGITMPQKSKFDHRHWALKVVQWNA